MAIPPLGAATQRSDFNLAQAYPPSAQYEVREMQPALSPLILNPSAQGTGVLLWAGDIRHQAETEFISLELQSDLSLGATYNHRFTLNLEAHRESGDRVQVPDGWYQVNLIIVKQKGASSIFSRSAIAQRPNAYDRFVTSISRIYYVSGGRLVHSFPIHIPNITAAAVKSHLYVQLIPLVNECERNGAKFPCIRPMPGNPYTADTKNSIVKPLPGVSPYLIEMPFVPLVSGGTANGSPELAPGADDPEITDKIGQYVSEAKNYKNLQRWGRSNLRVEPRDYAQRTNLIYMSVADLQRQNPKAAASLKSLFQVQGVGTLKIEKPAAELLSNICLLPLQFEQIRIGPGKFMDLRRFTECLRHVEKYLSLTRVTHFSKLNFQRAPREVFSYPTTFSLMTNFMLNRSRTEDVGNSVAVKPWEPAKKILGMLVAPLEAFGFTALFDRGFSVAEFNTRSQSESAIGSDTIMLPFNVSAFEFDVARATQCLEIRYVIELASYSYSSPGTQQGLYICDQVKDSLTVNEIYVHVYSYNNDSSVAESYSPKAQVANYSFRGDRDISLFFKMIRTHLSPDHNSKEFPFKAFDKADEFFAGRAGSMPMSVAQPITFQTDPPSMAEKLTGRYKERFLTDN
jgi:hypothetical protein